MPEDSPAFHGNNKHSDVMVLSALSKGWGQLIALRGMWLGMYLFNLLFSVIAIIAMFSWLSDAAGHSLATNRSIEDFDFTFITDLMRNYPGYKVALRVILLLGFVYFVFTGLLMGGVLHHFVQQERTASATVFLTAGIKYFWRILLTALLFLVAHSVLLACVAGVIISLGINPLQIENDAHLLMQLQITGAIYLLFAAVLLVIHDYVKIYIVRHNSRGIRFAIKTGVRFVFRNPGAVMMLYLLNLLILLSIFGIAALFRNTLPVAITAGLAGFVVSQALVMARVGAKLLNLGSANALVALRQA